MKDQELNNREITDKDIDDIIKWVIPFSTINVSKLDILIDDLLYIKEFLEKHLSLRRKNIKTLKKKFCHLFNISDYVED